MGERGWWRVAPALLMVAWGGNHFSPLLLLYRQQQGYTQVEVDLLFAVYIVGIIPGFLVVGPLSDRFGRKPVVGAGLVLGCLGSVVLALGATALPVLAVGRFVSGVSVAAAMVAGSSWIKELSAGVAAPAAARRASLTLTAGFGLGPAVSGSIAQWGPAPTVLPYVVHAVLSVAAAVPFVLARETRAPREPGALRRPGPVPRAVRQRFTRVVAPAAPWVFGCAAVAFATIPSLVASRTGGGAIAYATLLAVVGLAAGAAVQPFAARIGAATGGRQLVVGLSVAVVGMLLAALVALNGSPLLGVPAALVLGAGYGVCIVSGLTEVQRMAPAEHLAALTAVYYALTYLGFLLPVLLAALAAVVPEPVLLILLAVVVAACLAAVARGLRGGSRPADARA
ncbi:MFS transporter [Amnibacterium endophyticum]|uniref:MFS transporter n=1 Tax=Amnibacterium endophyticum TaxID=2109337 RepID=A0ABW4LJ37_9MICO